MCTNIAGFYYGKQLNIQRIMTAFKNYWEGYMGWLVRQEYEEKRQTES